MHKNPTQNNSNNKTIPRNQSPAVFKSLWWFLGEQSFSKKCAAPSWTATPSFQFVLLTTGSGYQCLRRLVHLSVFPGTSTWTALIVLVATCCMEYCSVGWEERSTTRKNYVLVIVFVVTVLLFPSYLLQSSLKKSLSFLHVYESLLSQLRFWSAW